MFCVRSQALFSIVGAHVDQSQLQQSMREEARKEQAVEQRRAASEASQELDKAEGFDKLPKDDDVVENPLHSDAGSGEEEFEDFENPLGIRRQDAAFSEASRSSSSSTSPKSVRTTDT